MAGLVRAPSSMLHLDIASVLMSRSADVLLHEQTSILAAFLLRHSTAEIRILLKLLHERAFLFHDVPYCMAQSSGASLAPVL